MSTDGLALLVVLGLGGLVLWYLTKKTAPVPLVNKEPPCSVSGSYGGVGIGLSCSAIDKGIKVGESVFNKTVGMFLPESLHFGSTKVCRAPNNKDVFPNDMEECRKRYGIVDCATCGNLYNLQTRQWPWTAELNLKANIPAGTAAGATNGGTGWRTDPDPLRGETQVSAAPIFKPMGWR
jgi:hypothetical protein